MRPNQLSICRHLAAFERRAAQHGVAVRMEHNFEALLALVEATPKRAPLTPIFDCRYSDVSGDNAFWLKGTDRDGGLVQMQAVRVDDLEGETLTDHLKRRRQLYMSPHIPGLPSESDFDSCVYTRRITGRVCYHGEVWIAPDGPWRGTDLVSIFSGLAFGLALLRWRPDYMYGMTATALVRKGIVAKYGYYHMHPRGIRWRLASADASFDEWFAWMSQEDLVDLMEAS